MTVNPDVVHGCCRGLPTQRYRCNRRTYLYMPGRLCEKCVQAAQAQVLAALEAFEAESDD